MRILAALGVAAVATLTFTFATSFDADAKKKRMSGNYCPPMTVVRR